MRELAPGAVIADYRIERVVGQGGMGLVYLATQLELGRHVALKLIAPEYAHDERFRERFKQESRLAASIDHPNVIPVYEAREANGALFLAMRYVDGPDLRRLLKNEGPLEPERAAGIIAQLGSALDAAHARGLVHRDVKPGNVLLTAGDPEHAYLTDFGLVKRTEASADLTQSGQFVGTLDYMAPEQIHARRPDARTDVYSLGCVLFHTLTGQVPFDRDTEPAKIYAHLNDEPPRPSDVVDDLPGEFDEIVARAMAKEPDERFPSAGDLGRATRAAAQQRAPSQPERSVATGAAAPTRAATARLTEPTPRVPGQGRRVPPWARFAIPLVVLAVGTAVLLLVIAPGGGETSGALSHIPSSKPINWLDGSAAAVLVRRVDDTMERLGIVEDGRVQDLPLPAADKFKGVDVGSNRAEEVLAVYSRCPQQASGCNVFTYIPRERSGKRVPGASEPDCEEVGPSVKSGVIAYGVYPRPDGCEPGLYLKSSTHEPSRRVARGWRGGTELNEGLLAWVDDRDRVQVMNTRTLERRTITPPPGHRYKYPVAIDRGRLYFIDNQRAKGHSGDVFFIARTDARKGGRVDRYSLPRLVAFTGKPNFTAVGGTLYFSGDTEEDSDSGTSTITVDEGPRFMHPLSP